MRKRRILLVDDEPEALEVLKMRLEASFYEVLTAHDGDEGLQLARDAEPDLILLDVMMPGKDGFQVLKELKREDATTAMPVIMLTARGESKAIFRAQNLGAVDYLIKPCNSQELLDMVKRHI